MKYIAIAIIMVAIILAATQSPTPAIIDWCRNCT
jgi:hypothetical protein